MGKTDVSLKFESVFKSALDGIIIIDDKGTIKEINHAVLGLFGYEQNELIDQNVSILMPEPDHSNHTGYINTYLETKRPKIIGIGREVQGKRKDGTTFPFRLAVSELKLGSKTMFTGIIHDLTKERTAQKELKRHVDKLEEMVSERTSQLQEINDQLTFEIEKKEQTEKALVESQNLYRAVVENFPNGTISILDRDLKIKFIEGQGLSELIGKETPLVGKSYLDILDQDVHKVVKQKLKMVFGGIPATFEIDLVPFTYRLRAVPLEDDKGSIQRILLVNSNITQQKNAEREIFNTLQKEKELGELKSRFVSMASHEFRTPLSTILSSASLIARYNEKLGHEKIAKHTSRIRNNVRNLTMILNDFLSLEKLESDAIQVNEVSVDLSECIREVTEDMQLLKKPGQQIEIECNLKDPEVRTDRFVMQNILTNLVSNAIKYSPDNSLIRIIAQREKDGLHILVIDQGIGISKKDQASLFSRFFRASNAADIQGTGLGLHIVKRYAQLIDAQIVFESKLSKGSTFGLILKV